MLLYFIPTENRYVRTQGEAKKLGFGEATDVPNTDKDKLIEWLNGLRSDLAKDARESQGDTAYVDDAPRVRQDPFLVGITAGGGQAAIDAINANDKLPLADSLMVTSGAMDAKDILSKDQVRVVDHTGESFEGTREQAAGWLVPKPKPDFSASAVLSRSDNPGGSIDMIVEAIAKMRGGAALKRVAGAVAVKFEELSK